MGIRAAWWGRRVAFNKYGGDMVVVYVLTCELCEW